MQARTDSRPPSRTRMRATEDTTTCGSAESSRTLSTPSSVRFESCGHSNIVIATLNDLRINAELCDIVLKVEGQEVHAHRALLSANSPYFRAMFTRNYSEASQDVVELHGITAKALEAIVQFCYNSKLTISTDNVQEVLSAACMFQITAVKEACCEFMRRHLGFGNCLGIRAFADTHSCPQLGKLADDFAKQNFQQVVQSDEFLKLEVDLLITLISADDLSIPSEEKVFEAVVAWIKHDPANRDRYIADLLGQVRLPLLQPSFLCDCVGRERVVEGSPRAMRLVMEAMEYHLLPERRANIKSLRTQPRNASSKVQVILAVGGMGRREPTSSIEQYNPQQRQWCTLSPMGTSRWGAGVSTLENLVFVVGGSNESSRLNSVECYDVATDQWSALPEMSVARNGVGVVTTGGLLYAIGGFDGVSPLRSGEQFDIGTNKWTPIPDMNTKRFGLGACACEGVIYAVGGSDGSNLNTAECYNTTTKTWSSIAPMHICRKFPGVKALGGAVYAIGGCDATARHNSVERYIPSLNQWITVANLLNPRSGLGCAILDGFLYVAGGFDGTTYLSSMERYDPLTNEWTQMPGMAMSRDCVGITVVGMQKNGGSRSVSPAGGGGGGGVTEGSVRTAQGRNTSD